MTNTRLPKGAIVTLRQEGVSLLKLDFHEDPTHPSTWEVFPRSDPPDIREISDKVIALNPKKYMIEYAPVT